MPKIDILEFESPVPITYGKDYQPPKDCAELIIYDNDGPEGYFKRLRFKSSAEAVLLIMDAFTRDEIKKLNFTIKNFWGK